MTTIMDGYEPPKLIAVLHWPEPAEAKGAAVLSEDEVALMVAAVDAQVNRHLCPAWGLPPVQVAHFGRTSKEPDGNGVIPLMLIPSDGDASTLGWHSPWMGVVETHGEDRLRSRAAILDTLSHEACEIALNWKLDRWETDPQGRGFDHALESSDATQGLRYEIEYDAFGKDQVAEVADFVTPPWFGLPEAPGQSHKYGTTTQGLDANLRPGQLAPGGYSIVRHRGGLISNLYPSGGVAIAASRKIAHRKHSRTRRILEAA